MAEKINAGMMLDKEQKKLAEEVAEERGMSFSHLVRDALYYHLQKLRASNQVRLT